MNQLLSRGSPESERKLSVFRKLFLAHGVLGASRADNVFTERDRLSVVPLVFAFVPCGAVYRDSKVKRFKPLIRQHLESVGFSSPDEEFVEIVKEIADQIYFSSVLSVRKKMTLPKVRAELPEVYLFMQAAQSGRCSVCGVLLTSCFETLDHRIPFKLLGDPSDGANWQVICEKCNSGKWTWFSALQSPDALNWAYNSTPCSRMKAYLETPRGDIEPVLSLGLRYSVLAGKNACQVRGCGRTAVDGRLRIVRLDRDSLPVWDRLDVVCEQHYRESATDDAVVDRGDGPVVDEIMK